MKPSNYLCPQCGFGLDPDNPSEPVCPSCGADPRDACRLSQDLYLAAVLEDAAALAEMLPTTSDILGAQVSGEPEIAYSPDPELDFVIGDAEALMQVLTGGPVLVAGNTLVN